MSLKWTKQEAVPDAAVGRGALYTKDATPVETWRTLGALGLLVALFIASFLVQLALTATSGMDRYCGQSSDCSPVAAV